MPSRSGGPASSPLARAAVGRALRRLEPPFPSEIGPRAASALASDTGRLLEALAACEPAGRALLLGAAPEAGHWLRRGLRGGTVVALDRSPEALEATRQAVERHGTAARFEGRLAEPHAALDELPGPFHLVVLVAAPETRRLVDLVLPKLVVGGRLAVLGALRDLVAGATDDAERAMLERLRPYLVIHPQLATAILPVGDGVALAVKRRETIRELGGPY